MNDTDTAVLVIAHGSPDREWLTLVEDTVRETDIPLPIRVSYLGGVPGREIADELGRLEQSGANTIIVVPLFVSIGSTHLNEIRYMLGLIPDPDIETDVMPIRVNARLIWCSPLEDDEIVLAIAGERLRGLVTNPRAEALLVVGHGSDVPGFREVWVNMLDKVSTELSRVWNFKAVSFATLRPNTIRAQAADLCRYSSLVVLPLFLSEGYFTRVVIPKRLHGFTYAYNGKTILPHPLASVWIERSVRRAIEMVPTI